jgi:CRISPR/Cas system-associated exonuclease Cas4 (RecB family)
VYIIRPEDCEFHSADPLPDGNQHWRKTKVRFIYPHTVKINAAFRKRAERHVRETLNFFRMCDEVAAYQQRRLTTAPTPPPPTRCPYCPYSVGSRG